MPRIGDILYRPLTAIVAMLALSPSLTSHVVAQGPVDANSAAVLPSGAVSDQTDTRHSPESPGLGQPPVLVVPPASESRTLGRAAVVEREPLLRPSDDVTTGQTTVARDGLAPSGLRGNDLTRVLGALAAVVGLILLARTVAIRYMPGLATARGERPSGVIEILARYPIGRGQQLLVLKFGRRILLIHQAGTIARTLTEMLDADEVAAMLARLEAGASAGNAARFKETLQSFEREHDSTLAARSRAGAALAVGETEIIDLTRTQIRGMRGTPGSRRALR